MSKFFYGVIEGFYGRQWSWQQRQQYAGFLAEHGFDCYIYAPKGDARLRVDWQLLHSPADCEQLVQLARSYHAAGMRWGLGLSPLGLSQQYSSQDRRKLIQKVRSINQCAPDILCILFDDTRGDIQDLATRQLAITEDILAVSQASHHIVCPTYYSFDPVLEKVFGKMPPLYLETLGQGLAADVDVFWTGNKVISEQYTHDDITRVTQVLQRRPVIWDNYPVNDGEVTSNYLNIRPYAGRPHQLSRWTKGHIVNPMNQPHLSRLVLSSLGKVYHLGERYELQQAFEDSLDSQLSPSLARRIKEDWPLFQQQGLAALSEEKRQQLQKQYAQFDEPSAREVMQWLAGGYQFDRACLTG